MQERLEHRYNKKRTNINTVTAAREYEAVYRLMLAGGIGVILKSPKGDQLKYSVCLQYQTTNNEAEYEALLKGL